MGLFDNIKKKNEAKLISDTGALSFKDVEGLAHASNSGKDSITAAFNYFGANSKD